ncbi:hypothetical protein [Campylobacter lari]|uniref:hypothetical protein n=1 Tax=Campylobacter lari TaxID=201 RepID=UPI0008BE443A|nr:hypothetical protein [Campylobacter lari]EAJ0334468.1 hypothetical protein [Campylobacter lari]EAL7634894.1 hypothetical protein [Campylobacter lari]QKF75165.1 hypothetical protein CLLT_0629 [Campylobacter lari subsp. lari]TXE70599.1 hypothetical protein FPD43_03355 [Campylobacter lari]SET10856.1 hypothetical protein SAMN05421673_11521 [Campylobacter lari subsp. lari]
MTFVFAQMPSFLKKSHFGACSIPSLYTKVMGILTLKIALHVLWNVVICVLFCAFVKKRPSKKPMISPYIKMACFSPSICTKELSRSILGLFVFDFIILKMRNKLRKNDEYTAF